jgi:pantoate--beta-alanine ligase
MKVFRKKNELSVYLKNLRKNHQKIGFIPTMGALHQGHLALVKASLIDNDITVVSIFVNPTQFDNPDDLKKYPRTFETDLELLSQLDRSIIIFYPDADDFYDGAVASENFSFDGLEFEMEGKHRPGHFNGVATVVKKLFEVVMPDKAYFGEKDFQQLQIIKKLVEKEGFDIKIIPISIYREKDGLAMSSRNRRLLPKYRKAAPFIYQVLQQAKVLFATENIDIVKKFVYDVIDVHPLLKIEYFEIADENTLQPAKTKISGNKYRGFIVVYAGEIRLIDNIQL